MTLTRRSVIHVGLTAGFVASLLASARPAGDFIPHFVCQPELDPSGRFAAPLLRRGAVLVALTDDVGAIAMAFDGRWEKHPQPVAGLTKAAPAFVMRHLATRRQLALGYEGHHRHLGAGQWQHDLSLPEGVDPQSIANGTDWRRGGGALLASLDPVSLPRRDLRIVTQDSVATTGPEYFISWLLVPRRQA